MKITLTEEQIKKVVEFDRHMQMARAWIKECQEDMERKTQESKVQNE